VWCEHSDTCGPAAAARRKLLLDPWRGERRVALADAHVGAADMLLICTRMERCPPPAAVCSWLAARPLRWQIEGGRLTVCGGSAVRATTCTGQKSLDITTTRAHPAALHRDTCTTRAR
jgi:hypothetical protein